MARRIDPQIQENVERRAENEQVATGSDREKNGYKDDIETKPGDTVKNANAAGLGAIGRNDQSQAGDTPNFSVEEENE